MKIAGYETHPVANVFPLMEDAELQALADDIKTKGLLNGIVYQDVEGQRVILDGRNRLRACELAGIPPYFVKWDDPLEADSHRQYLASMPALSLATSTEFIISQNLHRRHLTASQRAMVAERIKSTFEAEAKERMLAGKRDPSANLREGEKGKATEKAAKLMNVSPRSVEAAVKVTREAPPEVVEAVRRGDVTVSAAAKALPHKPTKGTGSRKCSAKPRKEKERPRGTPPADWTMKMRRGGRGRMRRVPRTPEGLAEFLVREWPSTDVDLLVRTLVRLRGPRPSTAHADQRSPTEAEVLEFPKPRGSP